DSVLEKFEKWAEIENRLLEMDKKIAKEIYLTNKQIRNRRYSALNYMLEELNKLEKGHSKVI
ncbi:MAG: hypothetical protein ACFFDF_03700, partial [Candidatus Odinarchaeota archaeon]